ncbi:uncharacterized protein LOC118430637 [Branchiostoma floridae]|uniref:Uncharacterized protein LOC118430637 n=1 Tax=Branchiostoma floridae TaxID=7739 RepID=A0A9J7MAW9_BRAFL|nr:uncharacterized protein LOC118430637 [Branchiostoma floridae]
MNIVVLGDFHFLWEVVKCILLAFCSSSLSTGSLSFLKDLVDRKPLDGRGTNFNVLDEFLHHVHSASLTAALLTHLQMASTADDYRAEDSIEDIAKSFLRAFVWKKKQESTADDSIYSLSTSLLYHLMLYVDLRQSIRYKNGAAIIAHWRYWLPTLLGTGRSQYSSEAANLLANLASDWSEEMAALATNNRTVNLHGREGHGKPIDMLVEHYNKILKTVLKRSGGHLSCKHAKEVSLAIPLLDEARRFCRELFGTKQTVGHTSPSAEKDIRIMMDRLVQGNVFGVVPGRRLFLGSKFEDPVTKGFQKITEGKWLEQFLQKRNILECDADTQANTDDDVPDTDVLIDE